MPLAFIVPAITLPAPPVTRFRVTDAASGCLKLTVADEPTSKLFQLTMPRAEPCVTVIDAPFSEIDTDPATTRPPVGRAFAAGSARAPPGAAIRPRAISPAGTTVPTA